MIQDFPTQVEEVSSNWKEYTGKLSKLRVSPLSENDNALSSPRQAKSRRPSLA